MKRKKKGKEASNQGGSKVDKKHKTPIFSIFSNQFFFLYSGGFEVWKTVGLVRHRLGPKSLELNTGIEKKQEREKLANSAKLFSG